MYEDGEGIKQSYVLAAKWYLKAAEHVPNLGGAGQCLPKKDTYVPS
jgi:TPR repeat protein